jgi:hypothetical protein
MIGTEELDETARSTKILVSKLREKKRWHKKHSRFIPDCGTDDFKQYGHIPFATLIE